MVEDDEGGSFEKVWEWDGRMNISARVLVFGFGTEVVKSVASSLPDKLRCDAILEYVIAFACWTVFPHSCCDKH